MKSSALYARIGSRVTAGVRVGFRVRVSVRVKVRVSISVRIQKKTLINNIREKCMPFIEGNGKKRIRCPL